MVSNIQPTSASDTGSVSNSSLLSYRQNGEQIYKQHPVAVVKFAFWFVYAQPRIFLTRNWYKMHPLYLHLNNSLI